MYSDAFYAANERLKKRRAERVDRRPSVARECIEEATAVPAPSMITSTVQVDRSGLLAANKRLHTARAERKRAATTHRGNSDSWLDALRVRLAAETTIEEQDEWQNGTESANAGLISENVRHLSLERTVRVYPSLMTAIMRDGDAAVGRIWALLRHIDGDGRGWYWSRDIDDLIARKGSPYRVVGRRRLREIVRAGTGLFWERDGHGRLFLYSAERVAAAYHIERLGGDNVAIPIRDFLQGMAVYNAVIYSAFHAGRECRPISRETMSEIVGRSVRRLQDYDALAGIKRQRNFSIISSVDSADKMTLIYQHGRAIFKFTDYLGKQGRQGQQYFAIRLPNSYKSPLSAASKGRKRAITRHLRRLAENEARATDKARYRRLFQLEAKHAVKKIGKQDTYLHGYSRREYAFWNAYLVRS